MNSTERSRKHRLDYEVLARENEQRKARRRNEPAAVAAADHRYAMSFKGVARRDRSANRRALALLDQQVREGMQSL